MEYSRLPNKHLAPVLLVLLGNLACDLFEPIGQLFPQNPRNAQFTAYEIDSDNPRYMFMSDIWCSTDNDVYVAGFTDNRLGQLWHYEKDGFVQIFFPRPDFSAGAFQFVSIEGSGSSDIWVAGWLEIYRVGGVVVDSTALFHYDGIQWKEVGPRFSGSWQAVELLPSGGIMVGGTPAFTLQLQGGSWTEYPIPEGVFVSSIEQSTTGKLFAATYTPQIGSPWPSYLLSFDEGSWTVEDSSTSGSIVFGYSDLFGRDGALYSVGSGGLFLKSDGNSTNLYSTGTSEIYSVYGFSATNLFFGGQAGFLGHYNGDDVHQFNVVPPDLEITGIALTLNSVYVLANDATAGRSFVFRGR